MLDEYDYSFRLGKAAELRTGRDVVMISTGLMTMRALDAAKRLEADNVDVAVVHVPTIKPLDREEILRATDTDRLVVTLENHSIVGRLAESVASCLAFAGRGASRIVPIALPDAFLDAGALPTLHDRYGLSADAIVARVKAELGDAPEPPTASDDTEETAPPWPRQEEPPTAWRTPRSTNGAPLGQAGRTSSSRAGGVAAPKPFSPA